MTTLISNLSRLFRKQFACDHSRRSNVVTVGSMIEINYPMRLVNINMLSLFWGRSVWIGLMVASIINVELPAVGAKKFYEGPGVFPRQIFRARGYISEDHNIITSDNYQIRLTRARNPLINKGVSGKSDKIPIIFIHGIQESFNVFVSNSFDVTPKDFSNISLASESLEASIERLADEPSARSLPMLALNHGHEVWLMSRRGFPGSRTMLGNFFTGDIGENAQTSSGPLTALLGVVKEFSDLPQYTFSFNRKFWNFSLDEQAAIDVPHAIDYVLAQTGRKQLSVVGHSAGSALTLMALSMYPELNQKINNVICWSPAFSLGQNDMVTKLWPFQPVLRLFKGAFPLTFLTEPLQGWLSLICSYRIFKKRTICDDIADAIFGASGDEAPLRPEFISSLLYASSALEVDHLLQCKEGVARKFSYGLLGNLAAYGQPEPPAYNLTKVTLKRFSFYAGATDFLVSLTDVRNTQKLLNGTFRSHFIRTPFNHQGYFFHKDNARLAIIPSLHEIQEFSEKGAL